VQGDGLRQGQPSSAPRKASKPWEPEELAALEQVVDQFPLGQFTWEKRLEEFGEWPRFFGDAPFWLC
jgi:hypothetical protein